MTSRRKAFLICFGLLCAVSAHSSTIRITPSTQAVSVGQSLQASVFASGFVQADAPSIGAFDFAVTFDPRILLITSATFGSGLDILGLGSIQNVAFGNGFVELFEVSLDSTKDLNALQLDSFNLATLTFQTLQGGSTMLSISQATISDADGAPLQPTFETGSVQVLTGPPTAITPEPTSLLLSVTGVLVSLGEWRHRSAAREDQV